MSRLLKARSVVCLTIFSFEMVSRRWNFRILIEVVEWSFFVIPLLAVSRLKLVVVTRDHLFVLVILVGLLLLCR